MASLSVIPKAGTEGTEIDGINDGLGLHMGCWPSAGAPTAPGQQGRKTAGGQTWTDWKIEID